MFLQNKDKSIRIVNGPDAKLLKIIEPGIYNLEVDESIFGNTISLIPTNRYNKEFNITAGIYDKVINYVKSFIDPVMEESRKEMSKLNKLGLIFNGDPGTGKTFLAGQLAYYLTKEKGAIGIVVKGTEDSYDFSELVDKIREHDPDRFITIIFDEFEKDRCNTRLLSFLDGGTSKENLLIIGTTNNTSNLPKWVTERPGRFERIFEFTIKDKDVFESIVNSMTPEVYHGKLNMQELYENAIDNNLTIDAISIEVLHAIYRYKKQLVDPEFILKNPYSYIKNVVENNKSFEVLDEDDKNSYNITMDCEKDELCCNSCESSD